MHAKTTIMKRVIIILGIIVALVSVFVAYSSKAAW